MPEQRIETWAQLTAIANEYVGEGFLFRGVRKASYTLVPKVGREETFKVSSYTQHMEDQLFLQFQRKAYPLADKIDRDDPLHWLVLAQHHGLPTRLLDWTENVLVAAFFAVESDGSESDAAIYAFPVKEPASMHVREPLSVTKTWVVSPQYLSPRLSAQMGMFTLHHEPTKAYEPAGLEKFILPHDMCFEFRHLLYEIGFSRASLFPDLDGLAQSLSWKYKWVPPSWDKTGA